MQGRVRFEMVVSMVALIALMGSGWLQCEAASGGYKINPNPPTDGLVGSNYTPAYAVNQVQLWHDFRADVIERELAAAKKYFGVSTLRVYLHSINFFEDNKLFMKNLEEFLKICDKHDIRPGFVFFDGCHRDEGIFLDKPTEPVDGYHNSRWAKCPQEREWDQKDKNNFAKFKPYIVDVIKKYRKDERVLFWEIHNEPPKGDETRDKLKREGYAWAKALKPIQPVLNCEHNDGWGDCDVTDIVDSHVYNNAWGFWDGFAKQNPAKGCVFTEAGARWKATRRIHGGPTDVVSWLEKRRANKLSTPGVYLCWELMVGNSNCRWHWVDKGYASGKPDPEPEIPWCGLMWPDATPVSLAEAEACKRYVTGKSDALLLEYFESGSKGWKPYGTKGMGSNHGLYVGHRQKAIAGDPTWKDYIVEGKALIKIKWLKGKQPDYAEEEGDPAGGLLFRVNNPGETFEDVRCYSVSHTGTKLQLGKFENKKWKDLASYDLTKLETKSRPNEWSLIRIEAIGPKIRVWFNRYHGDKDKGLRIEYTDKDNPILSGAVGVASWKTTSLFDDIVVLPTN